MDLTLRLSASRRTSAGGQVRGCGEQCLNTTWPAWISAARERPVLPVGIPPMKLRHWLAAQTVLLGAIAIASWIPYATLLVVQFEKEWEQEEKEREDKREADEKFQRQIERGKVFWERIPGCSQEELKKIPQFSKEYYDCMRKAEQQRRS